MMKKIEILLIVVVSTILYGCGTKEPILVVANTTESSEDLTGDENIITSENNQIPEKELNDFEKLFTNGPHMVTDENNLIGYIDINGNYAISPQFGDGRSFYEGYAAVRDANTSKWGFIDTTGNYVIEPKYEKAYSYIDGYAVVYSDIDICGLIDTHGNYVIEPKYKEVSYYKEGYALVAYTNETTGLLIYHFIDENGNLVFGEYEEAYLFEDGITAVRTVGCDYYYFLTTDGELLAKFMESPTSFNHLLCYSEYGQINHYLDLKDGQVARFPWGQECLINSEGEELSPYFDGISTVSNGRILARLQGKEGFLDENYNWVIDPVYDSCGNFCDDYTWACNYDSGFYIIDKQGNCIMDSNADNHGGISIAVATLNSMNILGSPIPASNNNHMCGYVNQNYEEVLPFIYDDVQGFSRDGSYARAKYNGKWGIIDPNGNWLIEPKFSTIY